MQRAAGGWRRVGDVALNSQDLAGELAALRRMAETLKPSGFFSKIIIPNDQIKYLTLATGSVDEESRHARARTALEEATPYSIDELAYDISIDGPVTHVAAVARDTLAEAEAFAVEHQFNPLSFAAIPGDQNYLGEPFFGPSSVAGDLLPDGDSVEADGVAVVVIGDLETHEPAVVEIAEDDPDPDETISAEHEAELPSSDDESEPEDGEPSRAETGETEDPQVAAEPLEDEAASEPEKPEQKADSAEDDADPEEAEAPPEPVEQPPVIGFSSRRGSNGAGKAPPLDGVRRDVPPTKAPKVPGPETKPQAAKSNDPPPLKPAPTAPPPEELAGSLEESKIAKAAKARLGGFLSRRKPRKDPPPIAKEPERAPKATPELSPARAAGKKAIAAAVAVAAPPPPDETARMTVFGARQEVQVGGKPRFLGLILTAILLLFLIGVAAWASVFMDEGLSRLFDKSDPVVVEAPEPEEEPVPVRLPEPAEDALSSEDAAVLDALREPQLPAPLDAAQAEARYAVTGIWQRAPEAPNPPDLIDVEDVYLTSIDVQIQTSDAIALPSVESLQTDFAYGAVVSPAAAGTRFALDGRGLVIPTPEGATSPDGIVVYLGRPVRVPPPTPTRFETNPETETATADLPELRPRLRPQNLTEEAERTALGGLTRDELAGLRPRLRPAVEKEEAEENETPTEQAVLASLSPNPRPENFARVVSRAAPAPPPETQEVVAAVAPRTVTPRIPSSASVARQATVNNAINLRRVNLIGVYGTPSNRRALVRLPSGRYKKVKVGDSIDGGRISAIGDSELRYQKGGRNLVLKIPSS